MIVEKKFGKIIREIRKDKGLKLEEVAERSGLTITTISKVENGLTNPSIITLGKLAKALEYDLNELYKIYKENK